MSDDTAPCLGCPHRQARAGLPIYCDRNASPGGVGCVRYPPRGAMGLDPSWDGELSGRQAPAPKRGKRNGSRRRG